MMGCAFISQQQEATATVAAALDAGISWFDTAAAYGDSEIQLGEALAAAGGAADGVTVITKLRGDPESEPHHFSKPDKTAAAAQQVHSHRRPGSSSWGRLAASEAVPAGGRDRGCR
jgi:aryl-alcohol dehydrogenase-like predicted oxidoreductase